MQIKAKAGNKKIEVTMSDQAEIVNLQDYQDRSEDVQERPKQSKFGQVPVDVMTDPEVGSQAFRCYAILASFADKQGGCYPFRSTIAQMLGVTDDHVRKLISSLERAGWVTRIGNGGCSRPNSYRLHKEKTPAKNAGVSKHKPQPKRLENPSQNGWKTPAKNAGGKEHTNEHTREHTNTPCGPPDEKPKAKPKRKTSRATQVPDQFTITDAMRQWAKSKGVQADLEFETEQFLDHHRAKGSKFKDWTAAWRTWMGNTLKWGGYTKPKAQPDYMRGVE